MTTNETIHTDMTAQLMAQIVAQARLEREPVLSSIGLWEFSEEAARMHNRFALACREADSDEPR